MLSETDLRGAAVPLATVDLSGLDVADPVHVARIAREIDRCCRSTGFFSIVAHGIDDDLRVAALEVATELFALDPGEKDRLRVACPPGVQRGYAGLGAEAQALASGGITPPDLSETFSIGPTSRLDDRPFTFANVWPTAPGDLRDIWTVYRQEMETLTRRLLEACALSLRGDATAFDHLVTRPIGATRANHYPALDAAVADDQWRGGAHTDYGTLTVLATDGVPGLEIRVGETGWQPVDAPSGGFLVNIGDLLALLSDRRWRSTWHRVTTPAGPPPYPARTSIAHFQFPNDDATIEGTDDIGRPVTLTAGEYLTSKIAQLGSVDHEAEAVAP
jgi:isopenicillin N synthase-like dioxygenase